MTNGQITDVQGVVTEPDEHAAELLPENPDNSIFVVRAAVCVLRLPDSADSMFTTPEARDFADSVQQRVEAALQADARVTEVVDVPTPVVDNAATDRYWEVKEDERKLTDSFNSYQGLRFNRVTVFRVRVPAKNQFRYRSLDDVPSDEYLVAWDGQNVLVQWEQDTPRSTGSGGHVVLDLLEDVGRVVEHPVVVVACAAACHHRFVHADFVTFAGDHQHPEFQVNGPAVIGRTVETPYGKAPTDLQNLRRTYRALQQPLAIYGQAKTLAALILFLEWRARADASAVLDIAYQRAHRSSFRHPLRWLRDSWGLRGLRRESGELMAGLWLSLVTIDSRRGSWRASANRLVAALEESQMSALAPELDIQGEQIEQLDVSLLRESVAELGARLEGRQLLLATGSGAIAALAGAALAALLTPR